ncbi:MAG: HAMP domain-containing protein [Ramlibacter sp.]|nr:HAMP domain-containing protein [Ramlibacter sp.]
MRWDTSSIRTRLVLGAAVVLVAFMAVAGVALQKAHADSVRAAHYARLQGTVYLLLAGAELDPAGALVMPAELAEPRLSLPGSGLYASIFNVARGEAWESASAVGLTPPYERDVPVGEWRYDTVPGPGGAYLSASYGVRWAGQGRAATRLVLSVVEGSAAFDRETRVFQRTLWAWLGGAGLLLLLSQTLLLRWGLRPLRQVAQEIERIEHGEQAEVQGRYPSEIAALTGNLNTLIKQERVRQTRYKEALSYLAHSLKTPLAVLRSSLAQPAQLATTVAEQVSRMDHIVAHQLGRAGASGVARFAPYLALAPVVQRIAGSLAKVYADRQLAFTVDCPPDVNWRIDEGDAFEMLGNLLDNAAKWARQRVAVRLWREAGALHIRVQDDGPGFTDTQAILQLHVRMDEKVPGHGVGLAVVNDLVASHEGTLALGASPWGGAQVDIALPAA